MTGGIVFILHGSADAQYAAALADALPPLSAFPVPLSSDDAHPARYGLGAVCVVVWTKEMNAAGMSDAVLGAIPSALANTVICRVGDAALPEALSGNCASIINARGAANIDAPPLLEAIARTQQQLAERGARSRSGSAPSLMSGFNRDAPPPARARLAVRSAWGLAATLAVVGVIAPVIGDRAVATNVGTGDQEGVSNELVETSSAPDAASPALVRDDRTVQASHAPLEYTPLANAHYGAAGGRNGADDAAPNVVVSALPMQEGSELTLVENDVLSQSPAFDAGGELDPKTAGIVATILSDARASAWKVDAAAPSAPNPQHQASAPSRDSKNDPGK